MDMECQVRANEVRVALLTKQNERLRATIAKLRALAASGRPPTRNHSRSVSGNSDIAVMGQGGAGMDVTSLEALQTPSVDAAERSAWRVA